jgi:hypothetical protein
MSQTRFSGLKDAEAYFDIILAADFISPWNS